MSGSRKIGLETVLPREAVPETLARLTAEAPQGRLVLGEGSLPLDDWTEVKVSVKALGASCLVAVRVKQAGPSTVSEGQATKAERGAVRYKDLKKRMKQTFKHIGLALAAGQVPDVGVLADFIADSRRMTTYPGKGDALYPAYNAAVDRLEAAAASGDLAAMTETVAALGRMKKECHSRHA
jgi:XXXCH domain-containing protein